jgi:hypothetical protein
MVHSSRKITFLQFVAEGGDHNNARRAARHGGPTVRRAVKSARCSMVTRAELSNSQVMAGATGMLRHCAFSPQAKVPRRTKAVMVVLVRRKRRRGKAPPGLLGLCPVLAINATASAINIANLYLHVSISPTVLHLLAILG